MSVYSHQLVRQIETCFPQLKVNRSRRILTGWDNVILEVNEKYIFRFPRFATSEKHLKQELRILPLLSKHLTVPIPKYQFVWKGSKQQPSWFAGYRKIPGEPLTVRAYRKIWTKNLAKSFVNFIRELHNIDASARELALLPRYAPKGNVNWLKKTYARVRKTVYPLLDHDINIRIERFWASLLEDFEQSNYTPTLIHGDLTTLNILHDPKRGDVTGILDWSDARISDPALDFAGLFEINKTLGEEVLNHLDGINKSFRRRVDWYVRTIPFYEILWGIHQKSEKFKTIGLRRVRRRLETIFVQF